MSGKMLGKMTRGSEEHQKKLTAALLFVVYFRA